MLSIKIQKTNTNIHLLTHRLNTLHWLGARPKPLSEEGREIQTGKERERERVQRGLDWSGAVVDALRSASKLAE